MKNEHKLLITCVFASIVFGALAAGAFLLGYCSHLAADRLS